MALTKGEAQLASPTPVRDSPNLQVLSLDSKSISLLRFPQSHRIGVQNKFRCPCTTTLCTAWGKPLHIHLFSLHVSLVQPHSVQPPPFLMADRYSFLTLELPFDVPKQQMVHSHTGVYVVLAFRSSTI